MLPEDLKKEFRKPYGKVYTSPEQIRNLIKNKKLIAVGDIISYNLIKHGIYPDIVVFDKKEAREKVNPEIEELLENFEAKSFSTKNPPGSITHDLWESIKRSLSSNERVKIFVEGEEDLAVTPFVLESDNDTVILYGFEDKGFVLIEVNKDIKEKCKELLSQFKMGQ